MFPQGHQACLEEFDVITVGFPEESSVRGIGSSATGVRSGAVAPELANSRWDFLREEHEGQSLRIAFEQAVSSRTCARVQWAQTRWERGEDVRGEIPGAEMGMMINDCSESAAPCIC